MLTTEEATARVARGAAHLDQVKPGWFKTIDIGTLTLSGCSRCVLGQLFGEFEQGIYELGWCFPINGWRLRNKGVAYGFVLGRRDSPDGEMPIAAYQPLQDAWIAAIADRRLAAGDNQPTEQPEDKRGTQGEGFRPDVLFAHD